MRFSAKLWRTFRGMPSIYPLSKVTEHERLQERRILRNRLRSILLTIGLVITFVQLMIPVTNLLLACLGSLVPFVVFSVVAANELLVPLRCSGAIAHEYERGNYDLISLTPLGQLGATWLISVAATRPRSIKIVVPTPIHEKVTTRKRFAWVLPVIVGFIASVFLTLNGFYSDLTWKYAETPVMQWLVIWMYGATLCIFWVIDLEQTPALNLLCGMIAPTYLRKPVDSQVVAIVGFIFIQILTYGLIIFLGFICLSFIFDLLHFNNWVSDMSTALIRLAISYGIREAVVYALWKLLNRRLHTQQAELDLAFRLRL
jgi:hypothetical protein